MTTTIVRLTPRARTRYCLLYRAADGEMARSAVRVVGPADPWETIAAILDHPTHADWCNTQGAGSADAGSAGRRAIRDPAAAGWRRVTSSTLAKHV